MTTAIVPGSLSAVANHESIGIAEAFLSADAIVLVDVSGSMGEPDSRGGRRRYDVAVDELRKLQEHMPGRIAVVAFSTDCVFVPGGVPPLLNHGTDLAAALRFVQPADGCVRFVVISDGQPNDEREALRIAKSFQSRIDTIFVGPEYDAAARRFLQDLANARRGTFATADRAAELATTIETFMLGDGQ